MPYGSYSGLITRMDVRRISWKGGEEAEYGNATYAFQLQADDKY